MYRLLLVSLLAACASAAVLSEVNQQCIRDNPATWSNDNLIGAWYQIRKYTTFSRLLPCSDCFTLNFTKPTAERLQKYKDKYNDPDQPFNLDENPVLLYKSDALYPHYGEEFLIMGHNITKFCVLAPESSMRIGWENYKVDAYRILTPKYIMFSECAMRGNIRWLLSTERSPQLDEVTELAKRTPELARLEERRFCAKRYTFRNNTLSSKNSN